MVPMMVLPVVRSRTESSTARRRGLNPTATGMIFCQENEERTGG